MKNYNNEIVKATQQASKIKLHTNFNKSMEIIGKYPVLVQYIKLCDILSDWYENMINKTNDKELKEMRVDFVNESVNNIIIFSNTGDDNGLKPLVNDLKNVLSKMFKK